MSKIKAYVGCKIINACPLDYHAFCKLMGKPIEDEDADPPRGYLVIYPSMEEGGEVYKSWSPKAVFENAYRPVHPEEKRMIEIPEGEPDICSTEERNS